MTETQINVVLGNELHAKFKAKAALAQSKMIPIIIELVREWVEADDLPAK